MKSCLPGLNLNKSVSLCEVVLFIMLHKVALIFESVKSLSVLIQMKLLNSAMYFLNGGVQYAVQRCSNFCIC